MCHNINQHILVKSSRDNEDKFVQKKEEYLLGWMLLNLKKDFPPNAFFYIFSTVYFKCQKKEGISLVGGSSILRRISLLMQFFLHIFHFLNVKRKKGICGVGCCSILRRIFAVRAARETKALSITGGSAPHTAPLFFYTEK